MPVKHPHPSDLEPIERASRDELTALQLQRLQWTLRHAYKNVPHYTAAFDAMGVHPDDVRTLADLAKFPFTTKKDLRDNYPFGMFAVPRERGRAHPRLERHHRQAHRRRLHARTSTPGRAWSARSIRAAGGRPGDIVHVAYGYGLFTGGLGAHYGAERLGCTVIPMSGGQTERQVQLIHDFRPDIIMVTPSYMLAIADEFERQGIDPASTSLAADRHLRRRALDRCDARGDRVARRHRRGRHLRPVGGDGARRGQRVHRDQGRAGGLGRPLLSRDHRPETGEVLPDGEKGELVFTSLTKEALPIIRYRTRDLTRLLPPTARSMRRMEKITGRSDDMLIIRGVNVFPTQIEELILQQPSLAPHYYCEITRPLHVGRIWGSCRGTTGRPRKRRWREKTRTPHQVLLIGAGRRGAQTAARHGGGPGGIDWRVR